MHLNSLNLVRVCDHTFHFEQDIKVVVDLGMNRGEFSQWIVDHSRAHCYGAEPVPELYESLPQSARITARRVAIGGEGGTKSLSIPDGACASLSETGIAVHSKNIAVEVMTLRSFFDSYRLASIDLLKLDIEGAEIDVLRSMDSDLFARIGQITIEFHDFIKHSDRPIVLEQIRRIRNQGFLVVNFGWKNFTDVMCLNRRRFDIDLIRTWGLYVFKYRAGFTRIFRRWFINRIP